MVMKVIVPTETLVAGLTEKLNSAGLVIVPRDGEYVLYSKDQRPDLLRETPETRETQNLSP